MSRIELINASCADQTVDAVVNAANDGLWAGGGIFGGSLEDSVAESAKQCLRAYRKFTADHPDHEIDVKLCAFTASEMMEAAKEYETFYRDSI